MLGIQRQYIDVFIYMCIYINIFHERGKRKKGHEEDAKERKERKDLRVFNGKGHIFLYDIMFGK